MRDTFIFENHLGRRFVGPDKGVYLNINELRNYSWSYDVINNRISRFYRAVTSRKLPLLVCCSTVDEAHQVRNELLEYAEADIEAMLPGKVYVGDYYTTGYITASKKSDYVLSGRFCRIELTLTSVNPAWSREKTHVFGGPADGAGSSRSGFDYPYDYAYDYSVTATSRQIVVDTVKGNNFKLRIYGPVMNPAVMINGHSYKVNGDIKAGESLLIDSLNKTITLTTALGTKANWFANRDRENYIFELIPPGLSTVMYNGAFKFDLIIVEERSEPRWT